MNTARTRFIVLTLAATSLSVALLAAASPFQNKKPEPGAKPTAQDRPRERPAGGEPAAPPEDAAMMEGMMPGPEHAALMQYTGEWTFTSKLGGPDMPAEEAEESTWTAKIEAALDGRFLAERSAGMMMGMQVETRRLTGYNKTAKQYEANWTWSMDTGMLNLKGTSSDGGKTINLKGEYTNPEGKPEVLNVTMTFTDKDHFTIEIKGEGADAATMVEKYTRKSANADPLERNP